MRDKVTGFEGVAIAKTDWLTGCTRWILQPGIDKDGKIPDSQQFDELSLEVIDETGVKLGKAVPDAPVADTGGPGPMPTRPAIPRR